MERAQFRTLLTDHLLPMFAGTELGATLPSTSLHSIAAYSNPCCLYLKPSETADFRIALSRSQPFTANEKTLVGIFMNEVNALLAPHNASYLAELLTSVPRRVVARHMLSARTGQSTLQQAITQFEELSSQTYEGRPIVVALGITGSQAHGDVKLEDLWKEDFSRVVSNGVDSIYLCGADGRVFNVKYLTFTRGAKFSPYRLSAIAEWTRNDSNRVALVLNRNGEIVIFGEGELKFAKRRGHWRFYSHASIVTRLRAGTAALRQAIYESCLDVSFSRTGGCLALLHKTGGNNVDQILKSSDLFVSGQIPRTKLLAKAVDKPFQQLDRRLRQELLAMDGATVLNHVGRVVAAGAIVTIPGGSSGGGRTAAAIALSGHGLGIKISADGPISGYRAARQIFKL